MSERASARAIERASDERSSARAIERSHRVIERSSDRASERVSEYETNSKQIHVFATRVPLSFGIVTTQIEY